MNVMNVQYTLHAYIFEFEQLLSILRRFVLFFYVRMLPGLGVIQFVKIKRFVQNVQSLYMSEILPI